MNISTREKSGIVVFDIEGEIRRVDSMDITLHQLVKDRLEEGKMRILLNSRK